MVIYSEVYDKEFVALNNKEVLEKYNPLKETQRGP